MDSRLQVSYHSRRIFSLELAASAKYEVLFIKRFDRFLGRKYNDLWLLTFGPGGAFSLQFWHISIRTLHESIGIFGLKSRMHVVALISSRHASGKGCEFFGSLLGTSLSL